jgi:hypothetical protein
MSIQFWLIIMIIMSIVTIDGLLFLGSLTEEECKACLYQFLLNF